MMRLFALTFSVLLVSTAGAVDWDGTELDTYSRESGRATLHSLQALQELVGSSQVGDCRIELGEIRQRSVPTGPFEETRINVANGSRQYKHYLSVGLSNGYRAEQELIRSRKPVGQTVGGTDLFLIRYQGDIGFFGRDHLQLNFFADRQDRVYRIEAERLDRAQSCEWFICAEGPTGSSKQIYECGEQINLNPEPSVDN